LAYQWWVFLHIAGVLGFLLFHGVSVVVAFRVRKERDPARIMSLLELSGSTLGGMYVSLLILLGGGIVAGFLGPDQELGGQSWWGFGWIWTALAALLVTMVLMYAVASNYYKRLRTIAGAMSEGSQAVSEPQLADVLKGPRAWLLAVVGFGSLLFILYLMIFKPF
jgi:uncharacterized membrane protein